MSAGGNALIAGLAAAALAAPGCSRAGEDVTLAEVIERHTAAVGGEAALDSVRGLRVELRIIEPEFVVDGVYRAVRGGRMRIDVYAGGERVFTEALDGARAWQMGADSATVREADEKATAALWHGTQFPGNLLYLRDMEARGHRLELVRRDTVQGVAYHVLRLTLSDGFASDWYVHPDTWLIERRRDVRALHPDLDPTEQQLETRWDDFRPVGGVLRAFRSWQVDLASGDTLQRTRVERIVVNPELSDDVFEMPGSG